MTSARPPPSATLDAAHAAAARAKAKSTHHRSEVPWANVRPTVAWRLLPTMRTQAYQSLKERSSGEVVTMETTKVQLTSLTLLTKLREQGLKQVLIDLPWAQLVMCLIVYFVVVGSAVGCLLYWQTPGEDVPTDVWPALVFAFRGFSVLCLSPVDASDLSAGTISITMCIMVFSSIITLCLFDIIVEKFAVKSQMVKFADKVVLRRLPDSQGGYPMLTFRYANLSSEMLCNATVRFNIFERVEMPGSGESLMFMRTGKILNGEIAAVPPAFFFHHIIDEQSPLYQAPSEHNPAGCSFEMVAAMAVSVSGLAVESQESHAGWAPFSNCKVVADSDFAHMLGVNQGATTGTVSSDFSLFNQVNPVQGLPERSRMQPHLVAIGLLPSA